MGFIKLSKLDIVSRANFAWGFHLFNLRILDNKSIYLATLQKADVILGNSLQLSQYIVSGGRFIVVKNFYLCKKNFSPGKFVNCFRNSNDTWETRPFGEGLLTDWIFLVNAVGDIFPPYNLFTRIRRRPFCNYSSAEVYESVMKTTSKIILYVFSYVSNVQGYITSATTKTEYRVFWIA